MAKAIDLDPEQPNNRIPPHPWPPPDARPSHAVRSPTQDRRRVRKACSTRRLLRAENFILYENDVITNDSWKIFSKVAPEFFCFGGLQSYTEIV